MLKYYKNKFSSLILLLSMHGEPPHSVSGEVTQRKKEDHLSLCAAEAVHHRSDLLEVCHPQVLISLYLPEPST